MYGRLGVGFLRLLVVAIMLGAWEFVSRMNWVDPTILPPFSSVVVITWGLMRDPAFLTDLGTTVMEVLIAFALVAPLALISGFIIGENQRMENALASTINLMMTLPKSVFLPVFVLLFGIGTVEKVVFAMSLAYFGIVPSAIAAVHSVPPDLVLAARSFGASRNQMYRRIYIPAMSPVVMGGLRIGVIFTVAGVLFSEMYASYAGIGHDIFSWGNQFLMPKLFAGVLIVVVFTTALNEIMQFFESYSRARYSLARED